MSVSVTADGEAIPINMVRPAARRVDLADAKPDWRSVRLELRIGGGMGAPAGLDLAKCRALALLTAPQTATRIPVRLEPGEDGAWLGSLSVERQEVFGVATLKALITTRSEQSRARIVGESRSLGHSRLTKSKVQEGLPAVPRCQFCGPVSPVLTMAIRWN